MQCLYAYMNAFQWYWNRGINLLSCMIHVYTLDVFSIYNVCISVFPGENYFLTYILYLHNACNKHIYKYVCIERCSSESRGHITNHKLMVRNVFHRKKCIRTLFPFSQKKSIMSRLGEWNE